MQKLGNKLAILSFSSLLISLLQACSAGGSSSTGNSSSSITWSKIQDAQEIYYYESALANPTSPVITYKSGGSNPISAESWPSYTPPSGYGKNTTRYLQFNEQAFISSPGESAGNYTYLTTSDGYTWVNITEAISAMWPYNQESFNAATDTNTTDPFNAAIEVTTPPPGVVKVTANYKPQYMKYYANQNDVPSGQPGAIPLPRYFITDEWGNVYLMQASGQESAAGVYNAFESAVLPAGWTKSIRYLDQDLILSPALGPNNTYEYVLFRDSADNTYNQIYWSPSGYNLAAQVQAPGMPIWGGLTNDVLRITNSWDNTIYGGGGINTYVFSISAGTSTIEGFNGTAGDRLSFSGESYSVVDTESGTQLNLSGGGNVLLDNVYSFSTSWVVQ
jgi:hypothetical protein